MYLHSQDRISARSLKQCSRAGSLVIAFACIAECCSWTNLITESNLFAVFEQFLWAVLFLITGVGMALVLRSWPGVPWSWWLFVVWAIITGTEQGYEAFGLYLPRYLQDQENGKVYQGFLIGLGKLAECHMVSESLFDWAS